MAKAGTGNASLRSHDSASLSAYIAGIDLFFAGNVSAHEGRLNAESCYRYNAPSPRSDAIAKLNYAPSRAVPVSVLQIKGAFANCAVCVPEALRWCGVVSLPMSCI